MTIIKNFEYVNLKEREKGMITFFTPTFNRAKFLPRIYECLSKQTDSHFVWIIVNDGSSDNTEEIVAELLRREEIPILFISKPNGGKHSAFKAAFEVTETEYFMCMDDDDIYSEMSVKTLLRLWNKVKEDGDETIGAIRTLVKMNDTYASNVPVVEDGTYVDRTTLEQNYVYHIHQENWTCYRTDCLRQIDLFPSGYWMSENHTFYSEGLWQSRFARKFSCRYVNVALRTYTDDAEVSIIRSNKSRQHYLNMFINTKLTLDEQLDYLKEDLRSLIFEISLLSILQHKLGISLKSLLKNTNSNILKFFYIFFYPFTWVSTTPKINK